jgi:hypothetical protein
MFFHYLSKNKQKTKRAQQYIKALLLLFDKLHTVYKYNKKPDKLRLFCASVEIRPHKFQSLENQETSVEKWFQF